MKSISSHSYLPDNRNEKIKIYINGYFYNRNDAKISVFDSGFLLGDGVWESFRLHNSHLCFINNHINRLYDGARSIDIKIPLTKKQLLNTIEKTIEKNNMYSDVHIRVIVSRGLKKTPYQHPDANTGDATIVIIPEYKNADTSVNIKGISLSTVDIKRPDRFTQNPHINSLSKFNCIAACIQADKYGANEALMLDKNNNVSTCNSTNFFIVNKNTVITSTGEYCLKGITRQNIIDICKSNNIDVYEKDFSLDEVYNADEAFVTGTFAGVIPAVSLNNKKLGTGKPGKITNKLFTLYKEKINLLYPS